MTDDNADPAARWLVTITIAQEKGEGQAREQHGDGRAEDSVATGPIASGKIARAEKIVRDAASADADRQQQSLVEKDRAIDGERNAEKSKDYHRPCGRHPDVGELEIEQSHDAAGAEAGKERVEMQTAVVLRRLFLGFQLRVDKEEDERDGKHCIDAIAEF